MFWLDPKKVYPLLELRCVELMNDVRPVESCILSFTTPSTERTNTRPYLGGGGEGVRGGCVCSYHARGRSPKTIDPRIATMPERPTSGLQLDQTDIACTKREAPGGGGEGRTNLLIALAI